MSCLVSVKKSSKYFMHTRRLGFRKWRKDDIDIAFALWGDYQMTPPGIFWKNSDSATSTTRITRRPASITPLI